MLIRGSIGGAASNEIRSFHPNSDTEQRKLVFCISLIKLHSKEAWRLSRFVFRSKSVYDVLREFCQGGMADSDNVRIPVVFAPKKRLVLHSSSLRDPDI